MYVNQLEVVPPTNPHLQFPAGDIAAIEFERAGEYLSQIQDEDSDRIGFRYNRVHQIEITHWRSLPGNGPIFTKLGKLAREWATQLLPGDGEAESVAAHGIQHTIALNHITNLMPLHLRGMEDSVDDLRGLRTEQIRQFSLTNWAGMAGYHPNVFKVMYRWYEHLADLIPAVRNDGQEELLYATVGVPYALAASRRMRGYLLSNPDRGAELLIRKEKKDSS